MNRETALALQPGTTRGCLYSEHGRPIVSVRDCESFIALGFKIGDGSIIHVDAADVTLLERCPLCTAPPRDWEPKGDTPLPNRIGVDRFKRKDPF